MKVKFFRNLAKRSTLTQSIAILLLVFTTIYSKDITITAHKGVTHVWKGFGVWNGVQGDLYKSISESQRAEIANYFFKDLDFSLITMYNGYGYFHLDTCQDGWLPGKHIKNNFGLFLDDVKKVKSDVSVMYGPLGCPRINQDSKKWADYVARAIKDLKDNGIDVNFTEMYAEPQAHKFGPLPEDWPETIKLIRKKLDSLGLDYVNLLAPSKSSVGDYDAGNDEAIGPITADKEIAKILYSYSFHSYRTAMTIKNRNKLLESGFNKNGFVMTEGGDEWCDGTEAECKQDSIYKKMWTSAGYEASIFGNVISDINLGTSYWTWYRGFHYMPSETFPWDTGKVMGYYLAFYDADDHKVVLTPKYHMVKQFVNAFPNGTEMRWCNSDLTGGLQFTNIYPAPFGADRPPVHACVGQSKDGRWAIGILNISGSPASKWGDWVAGKWPAAMDENVTVHIEELENEEDAEYEVHRFTIKGGDQKEDNVTMHNGNVKISLKASEFVTLKSVSPTGLLPKKQGLSNVAIRNNKNIQVFNVGNTPVKFSIASDISSEKTNGIIKVGIYNMAGERIKTLSVTDPTKAISWDRKTDNGTMVSSGIFFAKIY